MEIELDGIKVEVIAGSTVMQAAEQAGTLIPHFCYHKKLSIAASCRMCLVDIEKMPKPVPACATLVSSGMVVHTRGAKAVAAQQSVMEFLLINHPLDCPICDQGGECQLQDIAVGYGRATSRYHETKREVPAKDIGPLIAMQEMSRCIHCTRCIRFGQEIAGVMELGMLHRSEHAQIDSFLHRSVASELSGNMIDLCPVGALTSKPFRYSARTWELSRRRSISPHDSTGTNLVIQVKNNRVMRVVPFENEAINECWIADRDRFSYEGLYSPDRLTAPMIKQGGEWHTVDWPTALEYVVKGIHRIRAQFGPAGIGALVSPHSTLEELYLCSALVRGLGSPHVDYRLRHAEFVASEGIRHLGTSIASLSELQSVLVVGSHLRNDHPLFAQRIRQATRKGCTVNALQADVPDWAMPVAHTLVRDSAVWVQALADIATAVANIQAVDSQWPGMPDDVAFGIARSLLSGDRKAILLGNAAAHHPKASSLLAIANWIAAQTGASVGYLTFAANTVGAQWVSAVPGADGQNAQQMLNGGLHAAILFNTEPEFDTAGGKRSLAGLSDTDMVVTISPFKCNQSISDVLLPMAPFTETSGTFVNAEGLAQSFHAAVRPLGDARPGWKVLRVLANMLGLAGFDFESSQDVLSQIIGQARAAGQVHVPTELLSNATQAEADMTPATVSPSVASLYDMDSLVRRAYSLQQTATAQRDRSSHFAEEASS